MVKQMKGKGRYIVRGKEFGSVWTYSNDSVTGRVNV